MHVTTSQLDTLDLGFGNYSCNWGVHNACKNWISIFLYNVREFTGDVIMNVLRTHPYTISGGIITSNPYYQSPEEWISKNT